MEKNKKDLEKTEKILPSDIQYSTPQNLFPKLDASLLEKLSAVAKYSGKTVQEFVEAWIIQLPDPDRKNLSKILKSSAETMVETSESIQIFCTSCEKTSTITRLFAGKKIPCPHCRVMVQVPL
ncbi:MAG: hypothetical protein AABZ60_01105 [Planctomycetota bacterium]